MTILKQAVLLCTLLVVLHSPATEGSLAAGINDASSSYAFLLTRFSIISMKLQAQFRFGDLAEMDEISRFEALRKRTFGSHRLQHKFWAFEHVALPSLAAQTRGSEHWTYIVAYSTELPKEWQQKLFDLQQKYSFLHVAPFSVNDTMAWFSEQVAELQLQHGISGVTSNRSVVTVRLDDDDAIAPNMLERLHDLAYLSRLDGRRQLMVSHVRGFQAGYVDGKLRASYYDYAFPTAGMAWIQNDHSFLNADQEKPRAPTVHSAGHHRRIHLKQSLLVEHAANMFVTWVENGINISGRKHDKPNSAALQALYDTFPHIPRERGSLDPAVPRFSPRAVLHSDASNE